MAQQPRAVGREAGEAVGVLCVADLLSQVPAPVHEGVGIWFFVVVGEIVGAEGGLLS